VLHVGESHPLHRHPLGLEGLHEPLCGKATELIGLVYYPQPTEEAYPLRLGVRRLGLQPRKLPEGGEYPLPHLVALLYPVFQGLEGDLGQGKGKGMRPPLETQHLAVKALVFGEGEFFCNPRTVEVAVDKLPFVKLPVVRHDHTTFPSRHGLSYGVAPLEAGAGYVSHVAYLPPVPFGPQGVRCVLDYRYAVLLAYVHEGVHVADVPVHMYGVYRPCALGYPLFHVLGVHKQSLRIYVAEHGPCPHVQGSAVRAYVSRSWSYHLVPGTHTHRIICAGEGGGAVVNREAVLASHVIPYLLLELPGKPCPGAGHEPLVQELADQFLLPLDGPPPPFGVPYPYSGLPSQYSELFGHVHLPILC